jgi:hypothetical protein
MVCCFANPLHLRRRRRRRFPDRKSLLPLSLYIPRVPPPRAPSPMAQLRRLSSQGRSITGTQHRASLTIATRAQSLPCGSHESSPLRPAPAVSPRCGAPSSCARLFPRDYSLLMRAVPMKLLGLNLAIPCAVRRPIRLSLSSYPPKPALPTSGSNAPGVQGNAASSSRADSVNAS